MTRTAPQKLLCVAVLCVLRVPCARAAPPPALQDAAHSRPTSVPSAAGDAAQPQQLCLLPTPSGVHGCIRIEPPPAQQADGRSAGAGAGCQLALLDLLCDASGGDEPCARLLADGAPAPFGTGGAADKACLRSTCTEVCNRCNDDASSVSSSSTAQPVLPAPGCGLFCRRCHEAGLHIDGERSLAAVVAAPFVALFVDCLATLCALKPWCVLCGSLDRRTPPAARSSPPPPPSPPRPPLPPGTILPPSPPPSGACGVSAPQSCLGIPCGNSASTCTQTTPQCCCGSDCKAFGDCCADRTLCCGAREDSSRGVACGSPPPGRSCQFIACGGSNTCNLRSFGGVASGCCCDTLCVVFGDCCDDQESCCGTSQSAPRLGQRPDPRFESSTYAMERILQSGINVARGVNIHTGAGLLVPQPGADSVLRIGPAVVEQTSAASSGAVRLHSQDADDAATEALAPAPSSSDAQTRSGHDEIPT